MKKSKFKCPKCKRQVSIEGTDKKICPFCGYTDVKIRKKWNVNPITKILQSKKHHSRREKREIIEQQLEEVDE